MALSKHRRSRRRQLVVALEMYAADHGHYPRSLVLLVPRYLGALPLDAGYTAARQGEDYFLE